MANQVILDLVKRIDWDHWLKRRGKGGTRGYRDFIVDVCIDVVKELEYAHDIDWVEMSYTDKTLHVSLSQSEKAYHGRFPFRRIDTHYATCLEMTKEKRADIHRKFKRLLLDALGAK